MDKPDLITVAYVVQFQSLDKIILISLKVSLVTGKVRLDLLLLHGMRTFIVLIEESYNLIISFYRHKVLP